MTCNGQTPFISVYMDINEAETEQEKKDLALIIEVYFFSNRTYNNQRGDEKGHLRIPVL